jgi:hypothetical protein
MQGLAKILKYPQVILGLDKKAKLPKNHPKIGDSKHKHFSKKNQGYDYKVTNIFAFGRQQSCLPKALE